MQPAEALRPAARLQRAIGGGFKKLVEAVKRYFGDDCPQMAAAISYYALFSVFPLLIFLTGVAGIVLQDEQAQSDVVDEVLNMVPLDEGEGRDAVVDAVNAVSGGSPALGALGLIGMAWSGSAVFGAVRKSLNRVYGVQAAARPFVQQKLVDLAMVLAVGLFFLASITATASLRIVRANSHELGEVGEFAESVDVAWDLASFLIPLVLSFVAFFIVYTLVPAGRRSSRHTWPGALLAALLFEAAKISFSIYLEHFAAYDLVYGSLGAVVALLFWVYLSANVMLLGAELADANARPAPAQASHDDAPLREKAWRVMRGFFVSADEGGTRAEGRETPARRTRNRR